MIRSRLFFCDCGSVEDEEKKSPDHKVVQLSSFGFFPNVFLGIENVTDVIKKKLTPRLKDLMFLAAYIYAADCATNRGASWSNDGTTESWTRELNFRIAVRDLEFWSQPRVQEDLKRLLQFLSDDNYSFEFYPIERESPEQLSLQLVDSNKWPFSGADEVLMFSGGLDSLAGAIETASSGKNVLLVSHRSVSSMDRRQRELVEELKKMFPKRVIHIPVWAYKAKNLGREHTQRTRSFLYSAIGLVVAESFKAQSVKFFENGIVSLNLPVSDEVLRARASRTTHPTSLSLLTNFYKSVTGRDVAIENPYLNLTKSEVVSIIAREGAGRLISYTCSCAHGWFKTKAQQHCGTCSQCIDRRIAIIATGQEEHDPGTDYVSDVFIGPRKEGYEKNMAVNYVRHALELSDMSEEEIGCKFNQEISRAVRFTANASDAALQLIKMHQRHGLAVKEVLEAQFQENVKRLFEGQLERSSMLGVIAGQEHRKPTWRRYADRICELLSTGTPIACKTHKPRNEPHLQEICDGILKAQDGDLVREFPFVRWSSSLTKPDWSSESHSLFIEAKYIQEKTEIRRITKEIAEDLIKYGDNGWFILFAIYDPFRKVTERTTFSEPIVARDGTFVHFI